MELNFSPSNTISLRNPSSSSRELAKQDSLDWIALANTTFSASLGFFGRLSKAGLEPLTIAISQWVFSHLPIRVQGEISLQAVSRMQAENIHGTMIWFGIGANHILHELGKTSQGLSSVLLTAALSEGFSPNFSATVLCELVRMLEVPLDLTPSYVQWQAFVRVCESLLASTAIGERINQLATALEISILEMVTSSSSLDTEYQHLRSAEPEQVAKFLLGIGSIQRGETGAIDVVGGVTCLWGYVICDMIFGLRVQICGSLPVGSKNDCKTVAENYNSHFESYQVDFVVGNSKSEPTAMLVSTDRTFTLHSAQSLPFHAHLDRDIGIRPGCMEFGMIATWRIPFDKLLQSMVRDRLSEDSEVKESVAILVGYHVLARHYSQQSRDYCRHCSPVQLMHQFARRVPELEPFCKSTVAFMTGVMQQWQEKQIRERQSSAEKAGPFDTDESGHELLVESLIDEYMNARQRILSKSTAADPMTKSYCRGVEDDVAHIFYLLLELASMLGDLVMDEALQPSLAGIRRISESFIKVPDIDEPARPFRFAENRETFQNDRISRCLELFSHAAVRFDAGQWSAISAGGIYCYIQYLMNPLQSYPQAQRVHLGRGVISMNAGARIYDRIVDQRHGSKMDPPTKSYLDSYPSTPRARVLVEESIDGLSVWFEQWQDGEFEGRQAVNPVQALEDGWFGTEGSWRGPPQGNGVCDTRQNPECLDVEERRKWDEAFS